MIIQCQLPALFTQVDMGADEYRITESLFPLVDKGADEYPITESLFTLVDMGADEYCITEYVNKYEFNKSYQLQLY